MRWRKVPPSVIARSMIEAHRAGLKDIKVAPSQGTHFFQNITSSKIGYITISDKKTGFVDWEWLAGQKAVKEAKFSRHLRFDLPISVFMDGHRQNAVILKPGVEENY